MNRPARLAFLLCAACLAACERQAEDRPVRYDMTPPPAARPLYRLAVHPSYNPQKLVKAYQPLVDYLNRQLADGRIELEASRDYPAYEAKIRSRAPALLLPNPWQTLEAIKVGYRVVAMAGDADDFRGLFIVRRDSPLRVPADLRGKTVSYPSPTALAACIMPQYFLHRHGIDIGKDIQNVYVGSQESSIMNAYLGQSAAAATWPPSWRLFQQDHPDKAARLKVIWETPPLLNNSVMVRDDVPPAFGRQFRQALLDLAQAPDGPAILARMATARFHPADDASYAKVRAYVARFEKEVRPVEPQ